MARVLFRPPKTDYLVPSDGKFRIARADTAPPEGKGGLDAKKANKKKLEKYVEEIAEYQRMLYATDTFSLLLVFQAMDAAGKDSTIRNVLSGVNPAGCQVSSFKRPSAEELDHDFLWRLQRRLPERGRIGVFNRSHYEEVLVVRVHPEYLGNQRLPRVPRGEAMWRERYESINEFEKHLARNGTVILKFFLNVSLEEQRRRLLSRIDEPEKNWKFEAGDLDERALWPKYMDAYQRALRATSQDWAPWYAIPADDKPFMRQEVARTIRDTLKGLQLSYPEVTRKRRAELKRLRSRLVEED